MLVPSKRKPSSPISFASKRIYLEYTWVSICKESLLICFVMCQGILYFHRHSRKRMLNILAMIDITPYIIDSIEDKSMFVSPASREYFDIKSTTFI